LVLGVGATYDLGAFKVKGRVQAKFLGSHVVKTDDKTSDPGDDFALAFDLLPYYAVDDKLTAYLSFGVAFTTGNEFYNDKGDKEVDKSSDVSWHVNPYISLNHGAGSFYAGFRLASPTGKYQTVDNKGKVTDNRYVNWSVPIGITIDF